MAVSAQLLFKAIQHNDQVAVKRALNLNPALVHAKHPRNAHTPLHSAASVGNMQLLRELLHVGASCHSCDCNNETPLHVAARQGHASVVKELVRDAGRRACLKALNQDGATPLHIAVAAGHTDVVQVLLNAGARGDLKDRAGRTAHDLVEADNRELAEVLIKGRQLTPGSAGKLRRIISPGVSPTPLQQPTADYGTSNQQQHKPDVTSQEFADTLHSAARANHSICSPARIKAGHARMPDGVVKQQHQDSSEAMSDQAGPGDQVRASADAHEQHRESDSQQSWLQYSPQRPVLSAFSHERHEAPNHIHATLHRGGGANAQVAPQARTLQHQSLSAAVHETSGAMNSSGVRDSAAYLQGILGGHNHQQPVERQQQQQQPHHHQQTLQLPSSIGSLRSARTVGPMAAGLARSTDYSTAGGLQAGMSQLSTSSLLGQQAAALPAAGLCGGVSHIVSPESSSGLLNGAAPTAQYSSRNFTATVSSVRQQSSTLLQRQGDSYDNAVTPALQASCSRQRHARTPASLDDQQPSQQHRFAALAAAVSASSCVGPLQLPVQSQLGELAGKVHQLEKWFEAQVELIPEWQQVLAVVQSVKRQAEDHQARLIELDATNRSQHDSLEHLAVQVAKLQGAQAHLGDHVTHVADEQESMKVTMAAFGEQTSQIESQVVHQILSSDECQVALIRADMSVADGRLSTLETAMQAIQEQLLTIQQQPVAAAELEHSKAACQHASDHGAEQAVVSSVRLEALEAGLAEMKLILLGLQKAQSAAAGDEEGPAALQDCSLLQNARLSAQQAATTGSVSSCRVSELQDEMNELKQRVADLSLSVCGIDSSKSLQGGAVEEAVLPFMESTSNCLQQHEQQLDEIQATLPRLEDVVEQRTQVCELLQQVSTLQTAFSLLSGGKDILSCRPASGVLSAGPLISQKSAADYLAMATSMTKLQNQMSALSSAVEQLQIEWEAAATAMQMENESARSAWEVERARMSASEREAVRRLAEQHKELQAREDKLLQIREAALAEEAARQSQFESEHHVAAALESVQEEQQLMETRMAGLAAATKGIQQQVDSLQGDLMSALADLQPELAQMAAFQQKVAAMEAAAAAPASVSAAPATAVHCPVNSTELCISDRPPGKEAAIPGSLPFTQAVAQQQDTVHLVRLDEAKSTALNTAAAQDDETNPFLTGVGSAAEGLPVKAGLSLVMATAVSAAVESAAVPADVPNPVEEAGCRHSSWLHQQQHPSGAEAAENTWQAAAAAPALFLRGRTEKDGIAFKTAGGANCSTTDAQEALQEPTVILQPGCKALTPTRYNMFMWCSKADGREIKGGNSTSTTLSSARTRSVKPLEDTSPTVLCPNSSPCGHTDLGLAAEGCAVVNKENKWSKRWQKMRLGQKARKKIATGNTVS